MYMVGPLFWRILFRIFVVLVGFLILSGAINTSIIGSTGVLMRVAEDGVLTDWFRKPHTKFGTSYRIVNLVFILQMFTIIASRGNVIMLGEAYAFGVIWSFTFNSLAMLVLRWKYKGERGWKVPPNLRIGKIEIPVGLLSVFMVLLATATVNLFTKSVATVSGIVFCSGVFHRLYHLGAGEPAETCADRKGDEGPLPTGAPGDGEPRVGGDPPRWRNRDHARRRQSTGFEVDSGAHQHGGTGCCRGQRPPDGRRRTGVFECRAAELQRARADGLHQGGIGSRELRQEVSLLVVPAGDVFAALAQTANSLEVESVVSGIIEFHDRRGPGISHGAGLGGAARAQAPIQLLCHRTGRRNEGVLHRAARACVRARGCGTGPPAMVEYAARPLGCGTCITATSSPTR